MDPATLALGDRFMEVRPDEAVSLLRRVQAAHPSDFWTNFTLGEVLAARRDADAIGFFRAAIALRPDSATAYLGLALALEEIQGRTDEAIECMDRGIAHDPQSAAARGVRGRLLAMSGRYCEAADAFRRALELMPGDADLQDDLARATKACRPGSSTSPAPQGR